MKNIEVYEACDLIKLMEERKLEEGFYTALYSGVQIRYFDGLLEVLQDYTWKPATVANIIHREFIKDGGLPVAHVNKED